jgi:hypothetical protein
MNSLKERAVWHTDLLIGNNHKINETTAFAKQQPKHHNGSIIGSGVFYVVYSKAITSN